MQHYAWGRPDGLVPWLGLEHPEPGSPQAELWFGAHPNGPSPLIDDVDGRTLADVATQEQVPLLVKILAAGSPLSIQVHPDAELARRIYDSPGGSDVLADTGAKTEMLIAVEPFDVLEGFRDSAQAGALFAALELHQAASLVQEDPVAAVEHLMGMDSQQVASVCERLLECASAIGLDDREVAVLSTVLDTYPGDPGVLVAAMMGQRRMPPGHAAYVETGVPHAYVNGLGVEVMTNSDNVLRLGLTPKHVAVAETLMALRPDLSPVAIEQSDSAPQAEYRPDGAPFEVIALRGHESSFASGRYRLVLSVAGEIRIRCGDESLSLDAGEAAVVLGQEPDLHVMAHGTAYVALER